ncbi:MAG: TraR/DksA family transcriptional regulator, partial [Candidatus Acidiferrum sp.]
DSPILDGFFSAGYRDETWMLGTEMRIHAPRLTMTKADFANYRTVLLSLRSRLNGDVSHLADEALRARGGEASGSLSNAPLHPADLGTDNFEQEFTLSLLQNQESALAEIADALDRIDKGTFGKCEECGAAIAKGRLQTLPHARYCVDCARKLQQSS